MAYTTIRDPGIAKGFSVLADVFGRQPAERAIQADLNRVRRDQILAETGVTNQKLAQMREQQANQVLLSSILAGNPDLSDPAARADMMSAIAGTENGMELGPKFATGATTFMQPGAFNENDLSAVLLGTGVVNSFDQTPTGQGRALNAAQGMKASELSNALTLNNQDNQTALSVARQNNDGEMARLIWRTQNPAPLGTSRTGGKPLDVSPDDTNELWSMVEERLQAQFPETEVIDPQVQNAVMPRVSQLYQQTRNAELAIQQALGEIGLETQSQDDSWWPTGNTNHLKLKGPAGGNSPADKPGAAGKAPPAAPGANAGQQKIIEGQTATNPQTGEKIIFKAGKWVPYGG